MFPCSPVSRLGLVALSLSLLMLCAAISGCVGKSAPTRFYVLSAPPAAENATLQGTDAAPLSLGVGPVELPAYLERSQIVTREGDTRLLVADFDQWAEDPRDALPRVLAENLALLVHAEPLVTAPWPTGVHPKYSLSLQIQRFDGELGKRAELRAAWSILDADGTLLRWRATRHEATPANASHAAFVQALGQCLTALATNVAAELEILEAAGR